MRFAILSVMAFVALLLGPRVEMPPNTLSAAPIQSTILPNADVPSSIAIQTNMQVVSNQSAQNALRHISKPTPMTMPVMPDIPEPINAISQDLLPTVHGAPDLIVLQVEPVRSVAKFIKPDLSKYNARITGNALNLRSGPGMKTAAIASLSRGAQVRITASQRGKWVPVEVLTTGQEGWVFHKFVERLP